MEKQILAAIDAGDFNTHAFAVASGADHQAVIGCVKSLEGDAFVTLVRPRPRGACGDPERADTS